MDKSILRKALADSPDPTPGYLYPDISKMTFVDQHTQQKLIAYLMDKLNPKNSVHVLAKTLKVVKVLCETGHADFQKEMQRQADFLKNFSSFRGNPDPKFGDGLNERVRQNAKDAIDAAFSPRKESRVQIGSGHGSNSTTDPSTNSGSSGFVTGQTISSGGGQGGDAHSAPMPTTNKWAEAQAAKAAGKPVATGVMGAFKSEWDKARSTGMGMWKEKPKTAEELMMEAQTGGSGWQAAEVPMPGGFGAPETTSTSGTGGGWKFTEEPNADSGASLPPVQQAKVLTAMQREVERLTAFKNAPQRVDLTNFLQNCHGAVADGSSWEDLAEALDAKLAQSNPWQQRLNALCAVEHVVRQSVSTDFNGYFTENPEDIQRNVHVVQSSLKEKAQKVLKMLNIPEKSSTAQANSTAQATQRQGAQQTTTFSGAVNWTSASSDPAPAPVQAQASAGGADLDLGGLDLTGGSRRTRGAAAAGGVDKTKLRKRAQMQVASAEPEEPQPTTTAGFGNDWGASAGTQGGWGDSAPATTAGWGDDQQGGGWGDNTGSSGFGAGFDAAASQPPAQQQPQPAKKADDFDDFFGSGTTQQQPKPAGPPPIPDPKSNMMTDDFLSTLAPAQPTPQQAPRQQQNQAPQPQPQPAAAAPAPAGGNPGMAAMMQQQQQMLQMLQSQMQQVMASDADPATKQAQFQALMQQQQQLMQMMTMMQQQAPAPQAQQQLPPAQPSIGAPMGGPSRGGNNEFAQLNEEFKQSMGFRTA